METTSTTNAPTPIPHHGDSDPSTTPTEAPVTVIHTSDPMTTGQADSGETGHQRLFLNTPPSTEPTDESSNVVSHSLGSQSTSLQESTSLNIPSRYQIVNPGERLSPEEFHRECLKLFDRSGGLRSNAYRKLKPKEIEYAQKLNLASIWWLMPHGQRGVYGFDKVLRARIYHEEWRPLLETKAPLNTFGSSKTLLVCPSNHPYTNGEGVEVNEECGCPMVMLSTPLPYSHWRHERTPSCFECKKEIVLVKDSFYFHCPRKWCDHLTCIPCKRESEQQQLRMTMNFHFHGGMPTADDLDSTVGDCENICKYTLCKGCVADRIKEINEPYTMKKDRSHRSLRNPGNRSPRANANANANESDPNSISLSLSNSVSPSSSLSSSNSITRQGGPTGGGVGDAGNANNTDAPSSNNNNNNNNENAEEPTNPENMDIFEQLGDLMREVSLKPETFFPYLDVYAASGLLERRSIIRDLFTLMICFTQIAVPIFLMVQVRNDYLWRQTDSMGIGDPTTPEILKNECDYITAQDVDFQSMTHATFSNFVFCGTLNPDGTCSNYMCRSWVTSVCNRDWVAERKVVGFLLIAILCITTIRQFYDQIKSFVFAGHISVAYAKLAEEGDLDLLLFGGGGAKGPSSSGTNSGSPSTNEDRRESLGIEDDIGIGMSMGKRLAHCCDAGKRSRLASRLHTYFWEFMRVCVYMSIRAYRFISMSCKSVSSFMCRCCCPPATVDEEEEMVPLRGRAFTDNSFIGLPSGNNSARNSISGKGRDSATSLDEEMGPLNEESNLDAVDALEAPSPLPTRARLSTVGGMSSSRLPVDANETPEQRQLREEEEMNAAVESQIHEIKMTMIYIQTTMFPLAHMPYAPEKQLKRVIHQITVNKLPIPFELLNLLYSINPSYCPITPTAVVISLLINLLSMGLTLTASLYLTVLSKQISDIVLNTLALQFLLTLDDLAINRESVYASIGRCANVAYVNMQELYKTHKELVDEEKNKLELKHAKRKSLNYKKAKKAVKEQSQVEKTEEQKKLAKEVKIGLLASTNSLGIYDEVTNVLYHFANTGMKSIWFLFSEKSPLVCMGLYLLFWPTLLIMFIAYAAIAIVFVLPIIFPFFLLVSGVLITAYGVKCI